MSTPPPPSAAVPGRTRPAAESAALLAGTAVNGLAAYLYIAVGTRAYGAEAFAPVSVLWTFWAVSVAVFTFPLQHWAIRKLKVDGHARGVGGALPRLTLLVVALAGALAGLAWAGGERLFGSADIGWPVLVFLVTVGSAFNGVQRGVLAGRDRFYATAANIAGENLVRLAAGIVAAQVADTVLPFAATLALGPLIAVFWPEALRLPVRSGVRDSVLGFLGGLAGGILIAQIVLNAGPAVLSAMEGEDVAVTGLFLSLALFRAPYLLALGLATRITGPLTAVVMAGDRALMRRIVAWTVLGSVALSLLAVPVAAAAGPGLIDLVFGSGTAPSSVAVAGIAAGSVLALGGLGLTLALVAEGRTAAVLVPWLGGLAVGVVLLFAWPGDDLARVVAAFIAAEVVALAGMGGVLEFRPLQPARAS